MRDAVVAGFRSRFGSTPSLVVRSPGRVNLIGDHTDYNDGFVFPAAVQPATWIAAAPSEHRLVRVDSAGFGAVELDLNALAPRQEWSDYVAGTLAELDFTLERGFDAHVATELPVGGALSSSAALEIGVARLAYAITDRPWDPVAAARSGQRAESEFVGMPCGIMDQLIVASAVAGSASFIDCRTLVSTPVPLPTDVAIVVLDTGTRRRLVDSAYEERRAACERVASALGVAALRDVDLADLDGAGLDPVDRRRARHVVSENVRTRACAGALDAGDVEAAGRLLAESHASLRDDYQVSSPALDAMASVASRQDGCHGARMTGGGFAGCAVALVDREQVGVFMARTADEYREATGDEPALFPTSPAAGVAVV